MHYKIGLRHIFLLVAMVIKIRTQRNFDAKWIYMKLLAIYRGTKGLYGLKIRLMPITMKQIKYGIPIDQCNF